MGHLTSNNGCYNALILWKNRGENLYVVLNIELHSRKLCMHLPCSEAINYVIKCDSTLTCTYSDSDLVHFFEILAVYHCIHAHSYEALNTLQCKCLSFNHWQKIVLKLQNTMPWTLHGGFLCNVYHV